MRNLLKGGLVALAVMVGWSASPHMTYERSVPVSIEFNAAEAKGFKSSFRSSSFRSGGSSRPSFSFGSSNRKSAGSAGLWNRSSTKPKVGTKPAKTAPVATTKKPKVTTGKTDKPATTSTRTGGFSSKTGAAGRSLAGTNASKGLKDYRAESSRFNKQSTATTMAHADKYRKSPVMQRHTTTNRVSYNTIQTRRTAYYDDWSRPSYMYNSYNTFGMWDAAFLWYMMSNNPAFFYHHGNSAEIREFRAEADRLARDNAELRGQLSQLDRQVQGMSGPRNSAYLPEGADPAVAFAPELVASGEGDGTLRVGTGGQSGMYYAFCQELARHYPKTECVNTNGSAENREGILSGKFGAVTIQSNLAGGIGGLQASLYPEVVFMLANKNADMSSIADFDVNQHTLYVGGGGARGTLENFVAEDSSYQALLNRAQFVSATQDLVRRVAADPRGVMMFVCALNCPLIQYAEENHGDELNLVAVNDWDFNDVTDATGQYLYTFVKINPSDYGKLAPDGALWGKNSVETLSVEAVFAISDDWVAINGADAKAKLESAMWTALTAIQQRAGVPN